MAVYAGTASAVTCYGTSPGYNKDKDRYFDIIDAGQLSRAQQASVEKLFSAMKQRLKGSKVITTCRGKENEATTITRNETLDARVKLQSDGKLILEIEAYNPLQKTSHNEMLQYFGYKNHHRIESMTDNGFVLGFKFRRAGALTGTRGNGGTIMIEELTELSLNSGVLNIVTTRYINGYFAQQDAITLR